MTPFFLSGIFHADSQQEAAGTKRKGGPTTGNAMNPPFIWFQVFCAGMGLASAQPASLCP